MTRPIKALKLPNLTPTIALRTQPEFIWVDPTTLLVDDSYQRELSNKSMTLIKKIINGWDWARFKAPVVAQTPAGLEVIDGQHTAIAAATHPEIGEIPVMVVVAAEMKDRAGAFVGHNKDRIALNQIQIHYAAVAAGDETAVEIQTVCERAGVTMLRYPPGNGEYKTGDTIAINVIRQLINRRGVAAARIVLQTIAEAHCAPVRSSYIKAVDVLLHDDEYRGQVLAKNITSEIMRLGPKADMDARVFAAAHNLNEWRALVVILFRGAKSGRRREA